MRATSSASNVTSNISPSPAQGLQGSRKDSQGISSKSLQVKQLYGCRDRYATGSGEVVGGLIQDEAENCWLPKRSSGNETARSGCNWPDASSTL